MHPRTLIGTLLLAVSGCEQSPSEALPESPYGPEHAEIAVVNPPLVAGAVAELRFRNLSDAPMMFGGLAARIGIPAGREWAFHSNGVHGILHAASPVVVPPGGEVTRAIDVLSTLAPGTYQARIGVIVECTQREPYCAFDEPPFELVVSPALPSVRTP